MIKRYSVFIILISGMLFLTGCAGNISRVDMNYGTSFYLARFNQTLNHDAEKNSDPVYGLNGRAAQKIMEKYQKGFEKETEPPNYIFNIKQ